MRVSSVFPGEYNCFLLSNNQVYDVAGGLPSKINNQPSVVNSLSSSLHHFLLLDDQGNCYGWGDNQYGEIGNGQIGGSVNAMYQISSDSNGKPFTGIAQALATYSAAGYYSMALKADGTVWVWGATGGGNKGDGTNGGNISKPTQVIFPDGIVIKKIQAAVVCLALDSNGDVWSWGGNNDYNANFMLGQGKIANYKVPTRIPLSNIKDIIGGDFINYAIGNIGQLYGWGSRGEYLGSGIALGSPVGIPIPLNLFLKPILQLAINSVASYAILSDGTLWAWGDNAQGNIGIGKELDFSKYNPPYQWNWGYEQLFQPKPVQIGTKTDWVCLYSGIAYVFYVYAQDSTGQLYSWGRNKYSVLGNGVVSGDSSGFIDAIYPNSWDVTSPQPVNPFALTKTIIVPSPYCVNNPQGVGCNVYNSTQLSATSVNATAGAVSTTNNPKKITAIITVYSDGTCVLQNK